ncbi:MAG: hypothetical protein M1834_009501 [Cirrosporium novae-zelandiae]|nr:MAG: hypothetical protein M1834_009501 [Cirrosporium novae-zelandiae]
MFRRPRESAPSQAASRLAQILEPFPVLMWGPLALNYLGVPIVVGIHIIVVRNEDYESSIQKLHNSGFLETAPCRSPPPEILETLPDPQAVLDEINRNYKKLDQSTTTFNYPDYYENKEQLILIPNSFAHLPIEPVTIVSSETKIVTSISLFGESPIINQYDVYDNLSYPHENILVYSFMKAALDDENNTAITLWGEELRAWISMMVGYLDINNACVDGCLDENVVEWFSIHFGRKHEATFGPMNRRITKRLGSGREIMVDMRGDPIL